MDIQKLEQAGKLILEGIGENPEREGLLETPKRFAKMMMEQCSSVEVTNDQIARENDKCFKCTNDNMVILRDINVFSRCEHHLALMYNMFVSVGYLPKGKVIGLSKIARIADRVCKRLQIQERIGEDIMYILQKILGTEDVIVLITAEHSCMTARGICKPGTSTRTVTCGGVFYQPGMKDEFLKAINN